MLPRRPALAPAATVLLLAVGATSCGSSPPRERELAVPAPSGEALPVGDLRGWRQTFVEDFTRSAALGDFTDVYGDRWSGYEGLRDTSGAGLYSEARVVSVGGGVMDLHLRTEDGVPLVAAPLPLVDGSWGGQLHGRFDVRFRADPVPGYKTAWLLWPDSDEWADGEVDFPEGSLTGTIGAFDHCVSEPERTCFAADTGATYDQWHTASIEWTPGRVTFTLDGVVVGVSDQAPSTPLHWVLQTETDGGAPPPTAAGHVEVDWVAVYEPS